MVPVPKKKKPRANSHLTKAVAELTAWMLEHQAKDSKIQESLDAIQESLKNQPTRAEFTAAVATIPSKEQMELLATKDDIAELKQVWGYIKLAAKISGGSGKWLFRALIALSILFGAFAVVTGGVKIFFISVAAWWASLGK